MKTIYIPTGETVHHASLSTDRLVVKGCLFVDGALEAKMVVGGGIVHAGTVSAGVIHLDELEAASVICERLIAKRVKSPEVQVSESAAVSSYLCASYVKAGKLTVTICEVDEVDAEEVVHLTAKKRTLFGTLLSSALRTIWTALTAPRKIRAHRSACGEESVTGSSTAVSGKVGLGSVPANEESSPTDVERNRVMALFDLCRETGYTLRIIQGTPEENAPKFDFDTETIIRPAA